MNRALLRPSAFARDLRAWLKSRPGTAVSVEATLDQSSADASHPSFKTHKLRGTLAGCWASGGGYDPRIVFEFAPHEGSEAILLLSLGTHDQVS